ncbi:molecular chaperone HtpG, partial [Streptomyces albidoflavus]
IYFMTGESRAAMENSPHMEAFRAKGLEVLLLTDPVDEVWVQSVPEFDGKQLQSVAKGEVDLDSAEEKEKAEEEREKRQQEYAGLLTWMTERLGESVKEVRLSSRLTVSPACIVSDTHDVTPALENMYRAMGQEVPHIKRILELNPSHALISSLKRAHAAQDTEPGAESELAETAELVHGLALLSDGGELSDPARFSRLMADRLERTL